MMEGRTHEFPKSNREPRMNRVTSGNGEEAAEVTRFLHQLVTEVARVHRGDFASALPSTPCSREELAAVLPKWKRFPGLAADNDVGRTVGRSHFARAYFLPAAADRIQGLPFYAHKISHHEGER